MIHEKRKKLLIDVFVSNFSLLTPLLHVYVIAEKNKQDKEKLQFSTSFCGLFANYKMF